MSSPGIVVADTVSSFPFKRLPNADHETAADQTTLTPTAADHFTADRADQAQGDQ